MQSTCSVEGCESPHQAKSFCTLHYGRWKRTGSTEVRREYNPDRGCSVDGCNDYHQAKGWCHEHYQRWRRTGDPLAEPKFKKRRQPKVECIAEDCTRLSWCKGLCQKHYMRLRNSGSLADADQRRQFDRKCSIDGCEAAHMAQGWCSSHYDRSRRTGDPELANPVGVNFAPRWLAPPTTWRAMHHRLRNHHGKANEFTCQCGKRARDWAYDHADPNEICSPDGRVFSADPDHYKPMCPSCHRTFDRLHIAEQANRESTVIRMQREMIDRLTARVQVLEQENTRLRRGMTA